MIHFHEQHDTKTIPIFLPADREASWLLLPSLVSLLSDATVQPENISAQNHTKVSLFTAYNFLHNFDIICISETFLNSETAANDPNLEILGYNMYRTDHPSNCKRGSVCTFYKARLPLRVLNISNLNEGINFEVRIAYKMCHCIHLHRS